MQGLTSWSFEFENQKWFDGFRDLATNGIDKPVLNVFRMYGLMKGNRLKVENANETPLDSLLKNSVRSNIPDIHALASADKTSTAVMVWNYHDADIAAKGSMIKLVIKNIPAKKVMLQQYSIDDAHSNAYAAWKKMGSPQNVTEEQYKILEKEGQLQLLNSPSWINTSNGEVVIELLLSRQAVSLVKLNY